MQVFFLRLYNPIQSFAVWAQSQFSFTTFLISGCLNFLIFVFKSKAATIIPQLRHENVSTPTSEIQAINEEWHRINKNCDDDEQWPGYRYENPDNSSFYGLVLIFDELENLTGIQLAIPRHLINELEQEEKLDQSQFHLEGSVITVGEFHSVASKIQ